MSLHCPFDRGLRGLSRRWRCLGRWVLLWCLDQSQGRSPRRGILGSGAKNFSFSNVQTQRVVDVGFCYELAFEGRQEGATASTLYLEDALVVVLKAPAHLQWFCLVNPQGTFCRRGHGFRAQIPRYFKVHTCICLVPLGHISQTDRKLFCSRLATLNKAQFSCCCHYHLLDDIQFQ